MTELDLLRRTFEAVPEPDDEVVAAARARLLAKIGSRERPPARPRPRRRLRLAAAVAVGVGAVLAGVLALVLPRGHDLTGAEIAAAANRAVVLPPGVIRHFVTHGRDERRSRAGAPIVSRWIIDRWVAVGPPYAVHWRWGDAQEAESTRCGSILYDRRANLVVVGDAYLSAGGLRGASRGRVEIHGPVRYRGTTTFGGIPAYRLVLETHTYTVVWVVRRDNYYPLRRTVRFTTGSKSGSTYVQTFSFEDVPRTARTEHLLRVAPHPAAFLLRTSPPAHSGCGSFGTYVQVTGERSKP